MATYENVIASVLQSRIAQGNNDTSFGMIFDARAAEAIWPGGLSVSSNRMSFNTQDKDAGIAVRQFLKANGFGIVGYPVVQGPDTFPANNAPGWVRTKFTFGKWPAAPLYGDAMNGLRNLMFSKIFANIKSVPNDLQKTINQLFSIGIMVYPANADAPWLTTEDREAFQAIVSAAQSMVSGYNKGRLADLAMQGNILSHNADLWARVERITAAVATLGFSEVAGKIAEMKAKLREFATVKKKALAIADTKGFVERASIYAQVSMEEAKVKANLGVLYTFVPGLDAELKGDGLGVWQLAAGVAATVIIAKIILVIAACGAGLYLMYKLTGAVGGAFGAVGGIAGVAVVGMGLAFLYFWGKKKLA